MSETTPRHKYHWLPNALTVSRILLIPVLVWAMLHSFSNRYSIETSFQALQSGDSLYKLPPNWVAIFALTLFIFCMITDFLDGYFARKWNIISDFGRMLDPIADKLLVAACLISICVLLSGLSMILIPALIIIGRDIFVSGIREHAANSRIILSPTKLAKWKTACEMLAILIFLISLLTPINSPIGESWVMYPPLGNTPLSVGNLAYNFFIGVLWLAAILSAYTGFHYFRSAMRQNNPITEFD